MNNNKKPRFCRYDRASISEIDYLQKLTPEEKDWLWRFLQNQYNAYFYNDGADIINDFKERKNLNKLKQRRLKDVYSTCAERSQNSSDGSILAPKIKKKKA